MSIENADFLHTVNNADITEDRENFLKKLQQAVDYAFENRKVVHFMLDEPTYEEEIKDADDQINYYFRSPFQRIIDRFSKTQKLQIQTENHQVSINNPHLYPILLQMAYTKLGLSGESLAHVVYENCKHETEHIASLVGAPHLAIQMGVSFFKSDAASAQNKIGLQSYVKILGNMTLSEYTDAYASVSQPSVSDKKRLDDLRRRLAK